MWIIHSNMKKDKRNEIINSMFETEEDGRRGEGKTTVIYKNLVHSSHLPFSSHLPQSKYQ